MFIKWSGIALSYTTPKLFYGHPQIMLEYDRLEAAYRRRTYYHNAHYSLDRGDGIEYEALFLSMSPCEIYERKVTMEQLHAAMATLPDKQAKRIYARYFLGLETQVIARSECSGAIKYRKKTLSN